ncbi:MAG: WG repeat-containing protein [Myroides sp.]
MKCLLHFFILLIGFSSNCQNKISYKFTDNRLLTIQNKKQGVIDTLNNVIIPFEYTHIEFRNDRFILTKDKKVGLFDINYQEIVPNIYNHILPRNNNRFILWSYNDQDGLVDGNGSVFIPLDYDYIGNIDMSDKFYEVKNKNGLTGIYDYNGNKILEEMYSFYMVDNELIFAAKGDETFIIDLNDLNKTIQLESGTKLIYTVRHYSSTEKYYQIVSKDNLHGVLNFKNEFVIPLIYDEIKSSQNWEYFVVKKSNKYGIVKTNSNIVVPIVYDKILFNKEYVTLKRKGFKDSYYGYGSENR